MATTLFLIRHGEVEYQYNSQGEKMTYGPDVSLSEIGKKQISDLADILAKKNKTISSLYTSPFKRTRQTTDILAKKLGVKKVVVVENLHDVYTPGQENIPLSQVEAGLFVNMESIEHLFKRICGEINKIISQEKNSVIGIVCHGDPIRVYIDRLLFPDRSVPKNSRDRYYLEKGWAYQIEFDNNLVFIKLELIKPNQTYEV